MHLRCDYTRTPPHSGRGAEPGGTARGSGPLAAPPQTPHVPSTTAPVPMPATVTASSNRAAQSSGPAIPQEPFWARLNTEAVSTRLDNEDRYQATRTPAPQAGARPAGQEQGTLSSRLSLLSYPQGPVPSISGMLPAPAEAFRLWQLYVNNVDPLVKIIHAPTIQAQVLDASSHPDTLDPAFEALLFAIFYAAAISTHTPDFVSSGGEQVTADRLATYRTAVNHALVRARFVESQDIVTLQAFVIYLVCGRFDPQGPSTWTLLSLAIRLGMRLDLHRETHAKRTIFDDEMRRRLWWQICILDVRTAEDAGTDPLVPEPWLSVPFPTNVNDLELHPEMSRPLPSTPVGAVMFYNNLRIDVSRNLRSILFQDTTTMSESTLQCKTAAIDRLWHRLDEEYFSCCDLQVPICGFSVSTVKVVLAKARLSIHITAGPRMHGWGDETDDYVFREGIHILEQTQALGTHAPFARWWWLVRTYMEWDALVLVLRGLCRDSAHPMARRAWEVVEIAFACAGSVVHSPSHRQRWEFLRRLRARAQGHQAEPISGADNGTIAPSNEQVNPGHKPTANIEHSADVAPDSLLPFPEDWNWILGDDARLAPGWCDDQDLRALF
nr:bikaverin cluster transcription factor bik5 [Quercus suber]